jgi:hypothetical protein
MAIADWPRKRKATLSGQHLSVRVADSGERWTVLWDTARKPGANGGHDFPAAARMRFDE